MNKMFARVSASALGLVSIASFAAVDVTTATTGITDATSAVVTVLGALITMGAAFFGLKKVKRLIGG
jgi:hypothetical protein